MSFYSDESVSIETYTTPSLWKVIHGGSRAIRGMVSRGEKVLIDLFEVQSVASNESLKSYTITHPMYLGSQAWESSYADRIA